MHLKPPRRRQLPGWVRRPLGHFQAADVAWPQGWAAVLLLATGVAHIVRGGMQQLGTTSAVLVALFGICYVLIGLMLRRRHPRALRYGVVVTAAGLALGLIGFITRYDRASGVNWFAMVTLIVDVIIIPLCFAGTVGRPPVEPGPSA